MKDLAIAVAVLFGFVLQLVLTGARVRLITKRLDRIARAVEELPLYALDEEEEPAPAPSTRPPETPEPDAGTT